jgi:hypothetical protein
MEGERKGFYSVNSFFRFDYINSLFRATSVTSCGN